MIAYIGYNGGKDSVGDVLLGTEALFREADTDHWRRHRAKAEKVGRKMIGRKMRRAIGWRWTLRWLTGYRLARFDTGNQLIVYHGDECVALLRWRTKRTGEGVYASLIERADFVKVGAR